jgi:cell division GTPase FtsZ
VYAYETVTIGEGMTINLEICESIQKAQMCCICAGMGEEECPMAAARIAAIVYDLAKGAVD